MSPGDVSIIETRPRVGEAIWARNAASIQALASALTDHLRLIILDLERLKQIAMFNPNYLHLNHEGRHLDTGTDRLRA